jgi:putative transposase
MPLICQFIASRRQEYGVAPICRALSVLGVPIAPRTYRARLARPPSKRALWDAAITEVLAGYYEPDEQERRPPECLYGATKMWAYLNREGIEVARCTVERLMRAHGWRGATRAAKVRTTVTDPAATRAPDLVNRQFHAAAPGLLHVADFTYMPLAGGGFGYTAFVIDAYAGLIPGWECSTNKHTGFVEAAIRQAVAYRRRQGRPLGEGAIHHSDAGSQGEFNWSSQHLDSEELRWAYSDDVARIGRVGLRCGRPVGRRRRGGSIGSGSGRRSLAGCPARTPA